MHFSLSLFSCPLFHLSLVSFSFLVFMFYILLSFFSFCFFFFLRRESDRVTPRVPSVEHPTTLHLRFLEEKTTVRSTLTHWEHFMCELGPFSDLRTSFILLGYMMVFVLVREWMNNEWIIALLSSCWTNGCILLPWQMPRHQWAEQRLVFSWW